MTSFSSHENKRVENENNVIENTLKCLKETLDSTQCNEEILKKKIESNLCKHIFKIHNWNGALLSTIDIIDENIVKLLRRRKFLCQAHNTMQIVKKINDETFSCKDLRMESNEIDYFKHETMSSDPVITSDFKLTKLLNEERNLIHIVDQQLLNVEKNVENYLQNLKNLKNVFGHLSSNKSDHHKIECTNLELNESSSTILKKYGASRTSQLKLPDKDGEPPWVEDIRSLTDQVSNILIECKNIYGEVDGNILTTNPQKLTEKAAEINSCLSENVKIINQRIQELNTNLNETCRNRKCLYESIQKLECMQDTLEINEKLAQTRLGNRQEKPEDEQVFDNVQIGLMSEEKFVQEKQLNIEEEIFKLEELINNNNSIRADIEYQLTLKMDSLQIFSKMCPAIRGHYPSTTKLSGYE